MFRDAPKYNRCFACGNAQLVVHAIMPLILYTVKKVKNGFANMPRHLHTRSTLGKAALPLASILHDMITHKFPPCILHALKASIGS